MEKIIKKRVKFLKQNNQKAIYWHQRNDLDGYIDFRSKKANEVYNFVRDLSYNYKGAWALTDNFKKVRILKVKYQKYKIKGNPGHIFFLNKKGLNVVCKDHAIQILSYRFQGKKEDIKKRVFI